MDDETYERIFELGGTVVVETDLAEPIVAGLYLTPPVVYLSWADFSDLHRRLAADPRTQSCQGSDLGV